VGREMSVKIKIKEATFPMLKAMAIMVAKEIDNGLGGYQLLEQIFNIIKEK
jgi:hypothetical protein